MTEPRWTPGPWLLSDENRDDIQQFARFGPIVVYAEGDCEIHPVADCSCNHTCRDEEEQLANARLIAAAPELYAALAAMVFAYDHCRDWETIDTKTARAALRLAIDS